VGFELLDIVALISSRFLLARHGPVIRYTARGLASPLRMSLGVCPARHSGRMQHLCGIGYCETFVSILRIDSIVSGISVNVLWESVLSDIAGAGNIDLVAT
jgi:hypothetical protein